MAKRRIFLVHWNASEARERVARLVEAGYAVQVHATPQSQAFRKLRERPPDAFVIDLGRLPSHGGAVGVWARQQRATRHVPLVFVEGAPDKIERVRRQLPDATFTTWSRVRSALRRALSRPLVDPVIPGTMDGYSGTPLSRKLGLRADTTVLLLGAPAGFERTLRPLPEGVTFRRQARGRGHRVLLFVKSHAALERRFDAAARALAEDGGLWVAWPKQASGVATDLTQAVVRRYGLSKGLVDYKICSIDATWSGLLFARRRVKRR